MPAKWSLPVALLVALTSCSKPDYFTAEGHSGHFSDMHGRWLLINYWAGWCKPCINEVPELNRFQEQHRNDVAVLAVNFDGLQGDALNQQIARLGIHIPVLTTDPSGTLGYSRPAALPTTVVFGPDGKLVTMLVGPQSAESLASVINGR